MASHSRLKFKICIFGKITFQMHNTERHLYMPLTQAHFQHAIFQSIIAHTFSAFRPIHLVSFARFS